jgi:hypothetical protein
MWRGRLTRRSGSHASTTAACSIGSSAAGATRRHHARDLRVPRTCGKVGRDRAAAALPSRALPWSAGAQGRLPARGCQRSCSCEAETKGRKPATRCDFVRSSWLHAADARPARGRRDCEPARTSPDPALRSPPGRSSQPTPCSRPWIPWPELMRRVFALDVLECAKCGGPMRILPPDATRKVLESMGLSTRAPPVVPSRVEHAEVQAPS